MTPDVDWDALHKAASKARERAYAPYSAFHVGAAILTKDGQIFAGCNVENATYGATVCAERTAVGNMVSGGQRRIAAVFVIGQTPGPLSPCGICRQVLLEFSDDKTLIRMANQDNTRSQTLRVAELLPHSFTADDLNGS